MSCTGLREYFNAKPASTFDSDSTVLQKKLPKELDFSGELSAADAGEQFYDAIVANESLEEEDSDDEEVDLNKVNCTIHVNMLESYTIYMSRK